MHAEFGFGIVAGSVILEPPEDGAVFSYRGQRGPGFWSDLDPDWALCGEGGAQSPIDITGARKRRLNALQFDYGPSAITVLNNGHSFLTGSLNRV